MEGKNNFLNFNETKKLIQKLELKSVNDWLSYYKNNKPLNLPLHPERTYKKEWISWYDFLGKSLDIRKYHVNDNFFKEYSNDMFYILGFWFADGSMRENQNIFSITQHHQDRYLMKSILNKMNSNYPLNKHSSTNNIIFTITSKEIIKDIKEFGGHQRKTFDLEFPNIPEIYLPDFIRGFFDGDGCITFQKNSNCYVSTFISASENFIKNLLSILKKYIPDFNGKITMNLKYFIINMGSNDTKRLRDYMYNNIHENSLFLERKYIKFKNSGNINITMNKKYLNYKEASKFLKLNNIKTIPQWKKYRKLNLLENIPSNPSSYYHEYTTWKDFINFSS